MKPQRELAFHAYACFPNLRIEGCSIGTKGKEFNVCYINGNIIRPRPTMNLSKHVGQSDRLTSFSGVCRRSAAGLGRGGEHRCLRIHDDHFIVIERNHNREERRERREKREKRATEQT